ncbi:glycoside hydrolase family 16 protein [Gordonia sp. NPDC003376]
MTLRRRLLVLALGSVVATVLGGCAIFADDPQTTNHCVRAGTVEGSGHAPTGVDPALWRSTFVDTFDRCDLGSQWSTYSGQPGGNPVGHWDKTMVAVGDGVLTLSGKRTSTGWVTGGVSNYPVTQQYGRWEIRMRAARSADLSYHMLLWPQNEQWPPEIDFAESVASERDAMSAFVHWKADDSNEKAHADLAGDFADWHTVGVEWLPGLIRYLHNGKVWAEVRTPDMVPTTPMWLGLQVEAGACERRADWDLDPCSDHEARPERAEVEIDWVAVYAPVDDENAFRLAGYGEPTPGAVQIK